MSYCAVIDTNVLVSALLTRNLKHFPREPFIVTARQLLEILDAG